LIHDIDSAAPNGASGESVPAPDAQPGSDPLMELPAEPQPQEGKETTARKKTGRNKANPTDGPMPGILNMRFRQPPSTPA
jgi:hypothetical protein